MYDSGPFTYSSNVLHCSVHLFYLRRHLFYDLVSRMWAEYRLPLVAGSNWYDPGTQLCLLFAGTERLRSSSAMWSTRIFTSFTSLCLPGRAGIIEALLMKDRFNSEILLSGWHGYILCIIGEERGEGREIWFPSKYKIVNLSFPCNTCLSRLLMKHFNWEQNSGTWGFSIKQN